MRDTNSKSKVGSLKSLIKFINPWHTDQKKEKKKPQVSLEKEIALQILEISFIKIKRYYKLGLLKNILNMIKAIYEKPSTNIVHNA